MAGQFVEYEDYSFDALFGFLENCNDLGTADDICNYLNKKFTQDVVLPRQSMPAGTYKNEAEYARAHARWTENQTSLVKERFGISTQLQKFTRDFTRSYFGLKSLQAKRDESLNGIKEALAPYFTEHLKPTGSQKNEI